MNQVVMIFYPMKVLKPGVDLLDPDNTKTIYEYYLLENLSCGLVRDSKSHPTGYEGCIADRFYQENPTTWVFQIKEVKWSDASAVTAREITDWIENLRSSEKRHIHFLKLADKISYDEHSRQLKIHFPFEMDNTILHELSLADSGLIPPNFKEIGWIKTVGPYKVKEWNAEEAILKLTANLLSPLYTKAMPHEAVLSVVSDVNQWSEIFKSISYDIVPVSSAVNPKILRSMLENAPQIWKSHPMSMDFFVLNSKNSDAKNIKNRRAFSYIISELRNSIADVTKDAIPFLPETQLIPKGFNGRLESVKPISKIDHNLPSLIKIEMYSSFKDSKRLLSVMKDIFANHGVELEFSFSNNTSPTFDSNEFARLYGFLGNQLDASGSWSFLTGPPNGALSPWIAEYQEVYDNVFSSNDLTGRQQNLKQLHEKILDKAIAVPLMVGSQRYLLSDRIDASKWNQFSSRLRIYELRWK